MPTSQLDEHEIFAVAIKIPEPEAREAYLKQVCDGDDALFDRVSALVSAHDVDSRFLEDPPPNVNPTIDADGSKDLSGSRIGRYKLLQELGEGGFGIVYMAEQTEPVRRKVAIKVVKPGMDSREVLARFEAERQALALMDHPNIARVLDAGTTESGHPYFVMELVKGVSITRYADDNNLSTRARMELLADVCRAVQHAHQKGIIHRDIKPSNVLITLHDGKPVAKVIDFGVSKALSQQLTEKTLFTRYGQVIGTPHYMSPEQAELSGLDVDTRSDVYALGVLAYELLVGRPPFDPEELQKAGLDEMRRVIREDEPFAPSQLVRTLDVNTASTVATHRSSQREILCRELTGELDWITMTALAKDRNDRYATALEFSNDIQRFLEGDAVEAGPPTIAYRLQKAWRRNRAAITTAGIVAAAILIGFIVAWAGWYNSEHLLAMSKKSEQDAQDSKAKAVAASQEAQIQKAQAVTEAENSRRSLELVLEVLSRSGTDPTTGKEYSVSAALDSLAKGISTGKSLQPDTAAELHLGLARAFLNSGQRDRSKNHFEKAYELAQAAGWAKDDSRMIAARREAAYIAGDIEALKNAVTADRELNNVVELVKSLTLLGSIALDQGNLDLASQTLQEAVKIFPAEEGKFRFIELPHLVLADVIREQGNDEQAKKLFDEGVAVAKSRFWESEGPWYNTTISLSRNGSHSASERAFEIAKTCKRTIKSKWIKYLGHDLRRVGNAGLADRMYEWGITAAMEDNDQDQLVWNMLNRARTRFHARDIDGAIKIYDDVMDLLKKKKFPPQWRCPGRVMNMDSYWFLLEKRMKRKRCLMTS